MASAEEFLLFDPSPYQRLPVVNTTATLALARALRELTPAEAPSGVLKKAKRLDEAISAGQQVLTELHREQDPPPYGVPIQFDGGVDGLWGAVHSGLWSWSAFEHPGLDPIVNEGGVLAATVLEGRARADRAHVLLEQLFGEQGLQPFRLPFHEQSERTAAMVRLIEEDELQAELEELVGSALVRTVIGVQPLYETMVLDRLSTPGDKLAGLREVQKQLRWRINNYNTAVLGMLDDDEPESLELVKGALQPIVALREHVATRGRAALDAGAKAAAQTETEGVAQPAQTEGETEP